MKNYRCQVFGTSEGQWGRMLQAAAAVGAEVQGQNLIALPVGRCDREHDTKCRMDIAVDLECTYERECY